MRKRDEVKQGHERAVAEHLLRVEKIDAAFDRLGDASNREPDTVFRISDCAVGIEVATAYYNEREAQCDWEIATGEQPLAPEETRATPVIGNPDRLICERVRRELEDKCGKAYKGAEEIWLCINLNAALSDACSVTACAKELKIPQEHGFARIYLTYTAPQDEGGGCVAIRIF